MASRFRRFFNSALLLPKYKKVTVATAAAVGGVGVYCYHCGSSDGRRITWPQSYFVVHADKFNCFRYGDGKYCGDSGSGPLGRFPEGKGTYFYADGGRYEGNWKAGITEGKGTEFYADGSRYEGDWKAGKYQGKGTCFYADGSSMKGWFLNGLPDGILTY
jgi:hypothetical protein